jgi:hypothetical protein
VCENLGIGQQNSTKNPGTFIKKGRRRKRREGRERAKGVESRSQKWLESTLSYMITEKGMTAILASPFEQFEIHRIIPIRLGETLDLSITNSTVYMAYAVGIYYVLYKLNIERGNLVPGR